MKSAAVASWVENDEPFGSVPKNIPFCVVPVTVVVVPDVTPAELIPVGTLCIVSHALFCATTVWPLYSVIIGFCSAPVTPNARSAGPSARISTRRGIVPAMTKPTIASLPLPTVARAETFDSGAAPGISARLNRPVVEFVPDTVV